MDDDPSNDRADSSPGEDAVHQMSNVDSDDTEEEKNVEDEKDEHPAQFLNSTVSSHSNATTKEEAVPTCSTSKTHTGHIASCSNELVTSTENLYSAKPQRVKWALNWRKERAQLFQRNQQHQNFHSMQSYVFSPSNVLLAPMTPRDSLKNQLHVTSALDCRRLRPQRIQGDDFERKSFYTKQTSISLSASKSNTTTQPKCSLKNQDHLQKVSMHRPTENQQLRTNQTDFILRKEHPSTEVAAHADGTPEASQQHMRYQSHHQQFHSHAPIHPVRPPLRHSSKSMQNLQPFMAPQENEPSSTKSFVREPTESESNQQLTLEDIETLTCTFRSKRKELRLTKKEFCSVLLARFDKEISSYSVYLFESFSAFFRRMCRLKPMLESFLTDTQTTRTTNYLQMNPLVHNYESPILSQHMSGRIVVTKPQECENAFLQNPKLATDEIAIINFDSGIDGDRSDRATAEGTNDRMCHEGNDDFHKEMNVSFACHPIQSEPKRVSIEEMQQFVETFKSKRKGLGFTQTGVSVELDRRYSTRISQIQISDFENFSVHFMKWCELKSVMEKWLEDVNI